MMIRNLTCSAAVLLAVLAGPAFATDIPKAPSASVEDASAADAVRALYAPTIWNPLELESFSGVADPALSVLTANAAQMEKSGEPGCLDFVPTIDGQDYDDEEVAQTIKVEDLGPGKAEGTEMVVARFKLFKEPAEVFWTMRKAEGVWKVADIESRASQWRLSDMDCGQKK